MRVSIIIPCHGGAALTERCLRSLLAQQGEHDVEIVLADNNSPDATATLGALDPRVRVLRLDRNHGFAGGTNRGLHASRHPFVMVLNNDTVAAPDLLDRLHAALHSGPGIGIAAPVSNHVKGDALLPVGNAGATPDGMREVVATLRELVPGQVQDVSTLSGLCLFLRRETWQAIGDFDERFGHGNFEDDDFCLRARLRGLRLVIARDAFLHHEGHQTFKAMGLDYRREIERRGAQFAAKWAQCAAGRAHLCRERGDLHGAAAHAEVARQQWPRWPDADLMLARAAAARGEHAAALDWFDSFLRQCPRHSEAAMLRLATVARVDALRTGAELAALSALFVDEARAGSMLRDLGLLERERGNLDAAAAHLQHATACRGDDGELHNWLGAVLIEAGRRDEALVPLQRAAELGHGLAHTNLGIVLHGRGETARALHHFELACAAMPGDVVAHANLQRARALQPA